MTTPDGGGPITTEDLLTRIGRLQDETASLLEENRRLREMADGLREKARAMTQSDPGLE